VTGWFSRQQKARNVHPGGYWLIRKNHNIRKGSTFRVKKRNHTILTQDNKKPAKRLKRRNYVDQPEPMF